MTDRRKTARTLLAASFTLLSTVLIFRGTLYGRLPIMSDEPTGLADLIELLLGTLQLIALALAAALAAIMLWTGPRNERVLGAWLGLSTLAICVATGPLHQWVARHAL